MTPAGASLSNDAAPLSLAHVFVCPSLDGPLTGGTLYNRELLGALAAYGVAARALTIDEAFQQWGHERVLYDTVRAVRLNRPLVLTATFAGAISDGHGQQTPSLASIT